MAGEKKRENEEIVSEKIQEKSARVTRWAQLVLTVVAVAAASASAAPSVCDT